MESSVTEIVGGLVAAVVVAMGVIMKLINWRKSNNGNGHGSTHFVPRNEHQAAIDSVRRDITETRRELTQRIDDATKGTHQRLDKILLALTKEGRR